MPAPLFLENYGDLFGLGENRVEVLMEGKIEKLYRELRDISAFYSLYQMRNNVEAVKKLIPEIQEFVLWFLEGNQFGIEEELYQGMSNNLVRILEDILTALQQEDMVLMYDATACGLVEYLQLFVDEGEEEQSNDSL